MENRPEIVGRLLRAILPALAILVAISCGGGTDSTTGPGNTPGPTGKIVLSDSSVTLEVGFPLQLTATFKSAAGDVVSGATFNWSSDNTSVAQVTNGYVTPVSPGSARVFATSDGGTVASAKVTVIPTVVLTVRASRSSVTLGPGRTLQLLATPLDAIERPIAGRTVTFASSDNSIATVSSSGLIQGVTEGTATITATADTKSSTTSVLVVTPVALAIPVNGVQPTGMPAITTYSISVRDEDDSLRVNASGGLPSTLSGQMLVASSVQFRAVADSAALTFWPSRFTGVSGNLPASLPVVFVPRHVTLTAGTFAGATINTSVDAAITPCLDTSSYQCDNGFYPNAFSSGVRVWETLPIPVAVNGLSPDDSATVWVALNGLNDALGRKFFVPDIGASLQRITVQYGNAPGTLSTGSEDASYDALGHITQASVWFGVTGISRNLAQHEFIHALGFWHTCAWGSLMGGYGCPQTDISATDVAYISVAYSTSEALKQFRLSDGSLPCGTMGLWQALQSSQQTIKCNGTKLIANALSAPHRSSVLSDGAQLRHQTAR